MRRNKPQQIRKSRSQVKKDYQERLIIQANAVREDHDTTIELKMATEELSFWHEVISDAFDEASDRQDIDVMEALDDIREFDEMLCELEEIMAFSPEGGSIHLTINQMHKLLSATEMRKLSHRFNEPNIELFRLAEGYENELKRLAQPYQKQLEALDQVIGIAR
ncbi:hypothetical protein [Paenibacillus urinalis]|uniref:Uncharacterized protein n=1 Tax=Paenibacillus urinalis TaxID=521520 RepID=A0AAX3MXV4_9BACL|nr:hypothetical protein [Paenibacillus urinalis]WDH82446.1 hypothetical protein PUW23_23870 [Paenibacillus urinalis]WDI02194.1 hypothetical protein PUW25_23865 [Paenibacillus urinalis]